eukprot:gene5417-6756_t
MSITIGFAEEPYDSNELTSDYFPNKIGGKPAWLDLGKIPKREELRCKKCSKQMSFLVQIYAPLDEFEHTFHRSCFVFACQNGKCHSYTVLRSQLPQINPYYHPDAEEMRYEQDPTAMDPKYKSSRQRTCEFCGTHATQHCGSCLQRYYCCREHQQADWDLGHREESITEGSDSQTPPPSNSSIEQFQDYLDATGKSADFSDETFTSITDKSFLEFKNTISTNKNQVLRYCRDNKYKILWVSDQNKPDLDKDIPVCENCGSKRKFEFQILPQLLYFIGMDTEKAVALDEIDFGVLNIFTCSKSCDYNTNTEQQKGYIQEFIWKQDFTK